MVAKTLFFHQLQSLATLFVPVQVTTIACRSMSCLLCLHFPDTGSQFMATLVDLSSARYSMCPASCNPISWPTLTTSKSNITFLNFIIHHRVTLWDSHDSSDTSLVEYVQPVSVILYFSTSSCNAVGTQKSFIQSQQNISSTVHNRVTTDHHHHHHITFVKRLL